MIDIGPFVVAPVVVAALLRYVVWPWARSQEWGQRIEDFFQPVDDEELDDIGNRKRK